MLVDIDYGEAVAKLKRESDFLIQHLEARDWQKAFASASKISGWISIVLAYIMFAEKQGD